MWGRIHLIPMLQAEEDRDLVRRHWADIEREKMLLGTETKVYHSNRYAQFVVFVFSWKLISATTFTSLVFGGKFYSGIAD